jgi:hypothetical protein
MCDSHLRESVVFYLRVVSSFTLHTLPKTIVCCLQLNTGGCRGCNPEGGLLVIDAVGLLTYSDCLKQAYKNRVVEKSNHNDI